MKNAPIQHRLELVLFRLARFTLGLLPSELRRALGRGFGFIGYRLDRRRRRTAIENISHALPELDPVSRRRVARRSFESLGATAFDVVGSLAYDARELCRRWQLDGWHYLDEAMERGRGVIFLSAHYGNWEIAAQALALSAHPTLVVGRPPDNPYLLDAMVSLRERFGNQHVSKRRAARKLLRELKAGGRVGLLVDQRVPPQEAILVPFFGRDALTTPLVAELSQRTGAAVMAIFCIHQMGGRYRVWLTEPVYPDGSEGAAGTRALTERYLQELEREIRQRPELWLWGHKRWQLHWN